MIKSVVLIIAVFILSSIYVHSQATQASNNFQSIYLSTKSIPTKDSFLSADDNDDVAVETKERVVKQLSPLGLSKDDIRLHKVIYNDETYYDLIIRKKPYVGSVLLTNYYWKTKHKRKVGEYGLRSINPISITRDEQRLYNNIFIGSKQKLYFLVDSTPEKDPYFGQAFRIRLPLYVVYGYSQTKEIYGIIRVRDSVRINIRTFSRRFTDYKGKYYDNPIGLVLERVSQSSGSVSISKLQEIVDNTYYSVDLKYTSEGSFFKAFLIREDSDKQFVELNFSKYKEDKQALLIEAFYKGKEKKTVIASVYFKRRATDKIYYIMAIDKEGNSSESSIRIRVPKMLSPAQPITEPTTKPFGELEQDSRQDALNPKEQQQLKPDNSQSSRKPNNDGNATLDENKLEGGEEYWYNEGDLIK